MEDIDLSWLLKWFRKDWLIILICILTIAIHLLLASTDYKLISECNEHWQEQWNNICTNPEPPSQYGGHETWQETNTSNNILRI